MVTRTRRPVRVAAPVVPRRPMRVATGMVMIAMIMMPMNSQVKFGMQIQMQMGSEI